MWASIDFKLFNYIFKDFLTDELLVLLDVCTRWARMARFMLDTSQHCVFLLENNHRFAIQEGIRFAKSKSVTLGYLPSQWWQLELIRYPTLWLHERLESVELSSVTCSTHTDIWVNNATFHTSTSLKTFRVRNTGQRGLLTQMIPSIPMHRLTTLDIKGIFIDSLIQLFDEFMPCLTTLKVSVMNVSRWSKNLLRLPLRTLSLTCPLAQLYNAAPLITIPGLKRFSFHRLDAASVLTPLGDVVALFTFLGNTLTSEIDIRLDDGVNMEDTKLFFNSADHNDLFGTTTLVFGVWSKVGYYNLKLSHFQADLLRHMSDTHPVFMNAMYTTIMNIYGIK